MVERKATIDVGYRSLPQDCVGQTVALYQAWQKPNEAAAWGEKLERSKASLPGSDHIRHLV
jgi:hypothetical protein